MVSPYTAVVTNFLCIQFRPEKFNATSRKSEQKVFVIQSPSKTKIMNRKSCQLIRDSSPLRIVFFAWAKTHTKQSPISSLAGAIFYQMP